jgi:hypothetical protein
MDYRNFKVNGKEKHTASFTPQKRWWREDDENLHLSVISTLKNISDSTEEKARQFQYQKSSRLYGNRTMLGLTGLSMDKLTDSTTSRQALRLTFNVIQSAIDTLQSKIIKNRPKPMYLTNGGDYIKQKEAKKKEKFMDGIFYENKIYQEIGKKCFTDSAIFGDGVAKVVSSDGKVKIERVSPNRLYTDPLESINRTPRQLFQVDLIDRNILAEMFPEKASEIYSANGIPFDSITSVAPDNDLIMVVEAWHLPSSAKATDGKHAIVISNTTLLGEEYTRQFFPFAKLAFIDRPYGFWAQGAAEIMQGTQLEINKTLWVISQSLDLGSSFKVFLPSGSKIVQEHINNMLGTIIKGDQPPHYILPPIVQPEVYNRLETLKQEAYQLIGVSMLSASSMKPAGLDSGRALRTMNNIESERFLAIGKNYEQFFLDIAYLVDDCASNMEDEVTSTYVNKFGLEKISSKEIDLTIDECVIQVFPVSQLPNDPEGRLQTIQEYIQAGMISPRSGKRLLDFPDIEAQEELANAQEDYLHMILEKMIHEGEFIAPEPQDDLQLALELFKQYYAYAKCHNVEEEKLELLRQFSEQVLDLIQKATEPTPEEMQAQAMPPANPMAAPVSELVPNVNM